VQTDNFERRVEALEAENARLQDEIIVLKNALEPPEWRAPIELGLTTAEGRIIGFLSSRDRATKVQLLSAISFDKHADEEPEIKIVDVLVCKARKKLASFGITIDTIWGFGYSMDAESKSALFALERDDAA